jgi:sialidase-1
VPLTEANGLRYVFRSGDDGYHTFRIPSLLVTKEGTLLAFCEGRKTGAGDWGNIDLVMRRSTDGGKTWSPLVVIHEEGGDADVTIGNPCPVQDRRTGRILLPMTRINQRVLLTWSDDDGRTWAEPREITDQARFPNLPENAWYATGPGVGIQLATGEHAGRLVIPSDHRTGGGATRSGKYGSHALYSDDGGKSWQRSSPIYEGCNECQVVELADGRLLLNMRMQENPTYRNGLRGLSISEDGGESWGEVHFNAALLDPICQGSFLRVEDGGKAAYLFSCPRPSEEATAGPDDRRNLTVLVSRDECRTFPVRKVIHSGPAAYSCMQPLGEDRIAILFEGGKQRYHEGIAFDTFDLLE